MREGGNYKRNNHHRIWLEGHFQNGRDRGSMGWRWVEHRAVKRFGFAHNSSSSNLHPRCVRPSSLLSPLFSCFALITRTRPEPKRAAAQKCKTSLPPSSSPSLPCEFDLESEFCFDLSCRAYVVLPADDVVLASALNGNEQAKWVPTRRPTDRVSKSASGTTPDLSSPANLLLEISGKQLSSWFLAG